MDFRLINRLVIDKLRDRSTYWVALVVGLLINGYGHLLVPWFATGMNPFADFVDKLGERPGLTLFSVFLAFAFPFCVGTYSAVATRYKNRRVESIADFPERKPDPVFRATRDGRLVEVGAATQRLFERYAVDSAQKIVGEEVWLQIAAATEEATGRVRVYFEAEKAEYLVSYAPTGNDEINVYLTRVSA